MELLSYLVFMPSFKSVLSHLKSFDAFNGVYFQQNDFTFRVYLVILVVTPFLVSAVLGKPKY